MRKYADYLKYATEHEGYKVKGPWNENYVKPKPAKSDDATVIMVFKSLVDALPPPSGQGTGNGPVIRTMTQREQEKWQSSEIIPYVPIVSTANNASIALTGYDLNGFYKNEGEVKAAKENMVVDVALIYMGGSAAKNGLKAVDDVANGVKQGVSSEAVDLSKSTFRDMSNGRFVKNPVKEMQTRLDNAIESVQYGNDKAIYEKQLAEYNEVLKGSKEAKDLNDALYHAYDIAHSKGWDKIAFDYLKNLFTKK